MNLRSLLRRILGPAAAGHLPWEPAAERRQQRIERVAEQIGHLERRFPGLSVAQARYELQRREQSDAP